jgi:4-diphosphocytidyl-2-C-methyl-D-erythritol kinase
MIVFPNIKVNLGLNINEKRADGYHNLQTVFFPVPWTDILEAVLSDNQGLNFQSSGIPIPGDNNKNLVIRAFELLNRQHTLPGLTMHLHKNLPMGAGLGGGSSDGAFALKLINTVCALQLDDETLARYAAELGSDCPFFIYNRPMYATGRGELLEPMPLNLESWYMLIVMPPLTVGTAEAYSWITPTQPAVSIKEILKESPDTWKDRLINDFEAPVIERYPLIGEIKQQLYHQGAAYASMSGSGAAVFGLFRQQPSTSQWKQYVHWSGQL